MNIRELIFFKHLAGSLHFGRTSRACHITPSALTRAVQRLENELGAKLFVRDNRSVALTPAGEIFKAYARDALQRWRELQSALSTDEGLRGDISLYCSVTAAYSLLPRILNQFRKRHPAVHIHLETGDAARALTKLQNREVDISIAALPDKQPRRLACLKIAETPLVFIGSTRFPGTIVISGSTIDWQKTPLILPEHGLSRERIDRWFLRKNLRANVYAQVAGNEAIIAMVSLGCGIGVVPRLVLEKSSLRNQIDVLENAPPLAPFSIGVCTLEKRMLHPNVGAFWSIARQEAHAWSRPIEVGQEEP